VSETTEQTTKYKVGEWVYFYFAMGPRPFYGEIFKIKLEERGIFHKRYIPLYRIQIPKQEWSVWLYESEIARTQSELNSR
jgi:hypothetical protein